MDAARGFAVEKQGAGGLDLVFGAHVGLIVHYEGEADRGCFL